MYIREILCVYMFFSMWINWKFPPATVVSPGVHGDLGVLRDEFRPGHGAVRSPDSHRRVGRHAQVQGTVHAGSLLASHLLTPLILVPEIGLLIQ